MERPESRITLRVWKIPENPPKATAPVTGSRHLEAGKVWQRLLTPVVISAPPAKRARRDAGRKESSPIHAARIENSMIEPPMMTMVSQVEAMVSSRDGFFVVVVTGFNAAALRDSFEAFFF